MAAKGQNSEGGLCRMSNPRLIQKEEVVGGGPAYDTFDMRSMMGELRWMEAQDEETELKMLEVAKHLEDRYYTIKRMQEQRRSRAEELKR